MISTSLTLNLISTDATFYLARTETNLKDVFKDGHALLVASRCLNPNNWTEKTPQLSDDNSTGFECHFPSQSSRSSTPSTEQDNSDGQHESSDYESGEERADEATGYDSEANETHTGEHESCDSTEYSLDQTDVGCCSELPPDSRVLHNVWAKNNLAIPFFIAADSEAIIHLMTSTLYQWYVWCIDVPLVGLEICSDVPLVRLHIGWLENIESGPVRVSYQNMFVLVNLIKYQPIVHIACPLSQNSSPEVIGLYDLRSTEAIHTLSNHLLHLQSQVACVMSAISTPRLTNLCWRLDHLNLNQNQNGDRHGAMSVSSWLEKSSSPFNRLE